MKATLRLGDCASRLLETPEESVGSVICDPPYGLTGSGNGTTATGLMGIAWERDETYLSREFWSEVYRVLRPGGVVKMFSATRTYHRLAVAMGDAGIINVRLEAWATPGGMPKSLSIGKAVDALVLFGRCNSTSLSAVEKHRPIVGSVRRVVSSGRSAFAGDSRAGIKANMERWLNPVQEDIPVTSGLSHEAQAWGDWGTGLRPAWEPVLIGEKPPTR